MNYYLFRVLQVFHSSTCTCFRSVKKLSAVVQPSEKKKRAEPNWIGRSKPLTSKYFPTFDCPVSFVVFQIRSSVIYLVICFSVICFFTRNWDDTQLLFLRKMSCTMPKLFLFPFELIFLVNKCEYCIRFVLIDALFFLLFSFTNDTRVLLPPVQASPSKSLLYFKERS